MSKLLPTRLPISMSPQVESDTYNRLVRVLEINLGEFNPDNTRQITTLCTAKETEFLTGVEATQTELRTQTYTKDFSTPWTQMLGKVA